jgi:hypothetical protein
VQSVGGGPTKRCRSQDGPTRPAITTDIAHSLLGLARVVRGQTNTVATEPPVIETDATAEPDGPHTVY